MNTAVTRDRTRLLSTELRWMMALRWVAGVAVIVGGMAQWRWLGWYDHGPGFAALGGAIIAYNAIFWLASRGIGRYRSRLSVLLTSAALQVHLDLACITILSLWTGGVYSPLLGLYVLHMVFAGLVQPRTMAFAAAAAAVAMLSAGLWASEEWPPDRTGRMILFGWVCTLLVTVYLSDRISRALYRRESSRLRQIHRIREMSSRLRTHQAALIQHEKMVAMGRMAAGVAHEIANPLASMDSVLQLMQRNRSAPRADAVDALREQIQRIHRIVRQLTTFAHPGMGRCETVRVGDVIRASLDMLGFDNRLGKTMVEQDLSPQAAIVHADPHALQQVLMNLIINALDAMAEVPAPRLTIRSRRLGETCNIELADNGSGIAPEHIGRIFEPFFTTKPVGKGTGLGLSISNSLIREQGGELKVTSEPGRGTTFTIRLKAVTAPETSATASHGRMETPDSRPLAAREPGPSIERPAPALGRPT